MKSVKNAKKTRIPGRPFKPGNPGRAKGCKNKFTSLKESFVDVFKRLGGTEALYNWADKNDHNKGIFYAWITKMLPSNIDISGQISTVIKVISAVPRPEKKA